MNAADLIEATGGRRFVLALGCGVVTSLLQYFGKLDPAGSTYALVTTGIVGAYITGATMENIKTSKDQQP